MRILVTGGAGFIGSNLVRLAIERGHHVLCYDKLTYAGNLDSLADVRKHPAFEFVQGDIGDNAVVRKALAAFRPDWVLHLAAESHVDRSIDGPAAFVHTNIVGTFVILQAARSHWEGLAGPERQRFRFLHVSTDEVYGSLGPEGRFSEQTPYAPHSPYSASKAASDHLARAWHDTYGLPVLVTNCSNNYGPFQFPEKLIPVVILRALGGESIPVYGRGENVRDWLHVEDHVDALLTVAERGVVGETYNIGGDNEWRNLDLVKLLCRVLDELQPRSDRAEYAGQVRFVEDRPAHDLRYAIDASKLRTQLDWKPGQQHESGFRNTVRWYLEHRAWWERILSGEYRLGRLGLNQAG